MTPPDPLLSHAAKTLRSLLDPEFQRQLRNILLSGVRTPGSPPWNAHEASKHNDEAARRFQLLELNQSQLSQIIDNDDMHEGGTFAIDWAWMLLDESNEAVTQTEGLCDMLWRRLQKRGSFCKENIDYRVQRAVRYFHHSRTLVSAPIDLPEQVLFRLSILLGLDCVPKSESVALFAAPPIIYGPEIADTMPGSAELPLCQASDGLPFVVSWGIRDVGDLDGDIDERVTAQVMAPATPERLRTLCEEIESVAKSLRIALDSESRRH